MVKELFRQVENEPGWGSFHFDLKWQKDGKILRGKIQAVDFGRSNGPDKEYISKQFASGKPFVAWRYGERGVCGVLLNPEVQNARVHSIHQALGEAHPQYIENDVNPVEIVKEPYWIDATWYMPDQRLEMTGILDGKSFAAIIYYQPSNRKTAIWETQTRFTRPMDIDNLGRG